MECPRCSGSGVCKECDGQGFQECPVCDGEGQRQTSRGGTYNCKSCGGSGRIDCPEECASCEGTGSITEELQEQQRNKYKMRFANLTPNNKVVVPIIVVNVAVFIWLNFSPDWGQKLVVRPGGLDDGAWWNLLSAPFVHFDMFHLGLLMLFFWFYGPPVEGILGKLRFTLLYLFTGVAGSGAGYLAIAAGKEAWAFGASASMYGLVGAIAALHWRWGMERWDRVRRLLQWTGAFLVLSFLIPGGFWIFSQIGSWSNLAGFLSGFALVAALPRPQGR